ncbi:hypothetical protein [Kribbella deserti]|uniref:Lipoprotein n=1 Tax=Kribbella deserti TaxID=1926257 RepID=A0ABV6QE73_9ACTN
MNLKTITTLIATAGLSLTAFTACGDATATTATANSTAASTAAVTKQLTGVYGSHRRGYLVRWADGSKTTYAPIVVTFKRCGVTPVKSKACRHRAKAVYKRLAQLAKTSPVCHEDQPCWDPKYMGNGRGTRGNDW